MDEMQRLATFLYGFAPRSALLCSAEGDPPGDGGAPAQQQPPPATAQPANPPEFTPAQLAWIEAEKTRASNAAAANARRAEQARQKPGGEPPAAQPPAAPQAVDVSAEFARERAFGRALGRFDLNDKALTLTEREFATAKPADPVAWLEERADAYGWKRLGAPPNGNGQPASGGAPALNPALSGPPVTSRGAPPSPSGPTDDTPILSMSRSDQAALLSKLVSQHGYVEGNRKFAERHERELKDRNVKVRPRQ
jgi:hypothetical protein